MKLKSVIKQQLKEYSQMILWITTQVKGLAAKTLVWVLMSLSYNFETIKGKSSH